MSFFGASRVLVFGKEKVHKIQLGKGYEGFGSQKGTSNVVDTNLRRFFVGLFNGGMWFLCFGGGLEKDLVRLILFLHHGTGGGKILLELPIFFF